MHALHVVGARPNFMKMAAVHRRLQGRLRQTLVHTGQHYDWRMSGIFFDELDIPAPDVNLEVRSGSHAAQTAEIMTRFEGIVLEHCPDIVIVYGDVNSTLAAAVVCSKLRVPIAHVEAGLRSGDRTMPEEINRLVTDTLADILFTPSADGNENLAREGVRPDRVHLVGNVMIDTLVQLLPCTNPEAVRARFGLPERFVLVTLHRPSNVDSDATLAPLVGALGAIAARIDVLFPVHPRTAQRAQALAGRPASLRLVEPMGYLDFLALQRRATLVITDSGGVQEETTYLGVPCLTVRPNTERPITITHGTNVLVGADPERMRQEAFRLLDTPPQAMAPPPLWDGRAGERIAAILERWHG